MKYEQRKGYGEHKGVEAGGVPLSGCKGYLKGLKSAEEGRYDIKTQMKGR